MLYNLILFTQLHNVMSSMPKLCIKITNYKDTYQIMNISEATTYQLVLIKLQKQTKIIRGTKRNTIQLLRNVNSICLYSPVFYNYN